MSARARPVAHLAFALPRAAARVRRADTETSFKLSDRACAHQRLRLVSVVLVSRHLASAVTPSSLTMFSLAGEAARGREAESGKQKEARRAAGIRRESARVQVAQGEGGSGTLPLSVPRPEQQPPREPFSTRRMARGSNAYEPRGQAAGSSCSAATRQRRT